MKSRNSRLARTLIALTLPVVQSFAQSTYEPYTFTTLAGSSIKDLNGNPIGGYADGTGSQARFHRPWGVAVDREGNIYVADTANVTIRKVTLAGTVTTLAGLAGIGGSADGTGSDARFGSPTGVAVDSAGNVYVADLINATIRKVTPAGEVTTLAGLAGSSGSADGPGSDARFFEPYGVATDSVDDIYVADTGNGRIRRVTPAGVVTTLAGGFSFPYGVAVGGGNVYVADGGNHTILKVTPSGVVTTLAGLAGSSGSADGTGSDARFSLPFALVVDDAGNVYVADLMNSTIRKVTPAGAVTTLAGLAGSFATADGTGSAARFWSPAGVAMDGADNVYVADSENHLIRKGYRALMILSSGPGFGFNGGQFGFGLTGPAGQLVVVETSNDLMSWLPLWTNTFAGDLNFNDPQSGALSNRFYRARLP